MLLHSIETCSEILPRARACWLFQGSGVAVSRPSWAATGSDVELDLGLSPGAADMTSWWL